MSSSSTRTYKPDLNGVRDILHKSQTAGTSNPAKKKDKVFVDPQGGIRQGQDVSSSEARRFSEVQQDEFKGLFGGPKSRLARDRQTVREKLPTNTREIKTPEGITGWVYGFDCEYGHTYLLMVYFDGAFYQVQVLEPQLEKKWQSAHTGHIFEDGNICLGDKFNAGGPTLEAAYAKSVLWATGISFALENGEFPFNVNQ